MNGINDLKVAHTRGSLGYLHEATAMSGKPPLMADASEASNDPMERKRRWTTISIYLASIVERADEQILPALYYFVGVSLGATPSQLGILTLARALVQAFTSPLSGVLGDTHDRGQIIAAGCFLWGLMTAAMGLSNTFAVAVFFSAWNGLGLSLVIPSSQSLIADYYPARARGKAFGLLYMTGSFGGMLAGLFATNVGGRMPFGIEGWRFAYFCIAMVSLVTGTAVLLWAVDPRRSTASARRTISNSMWVETEAIFRVRSFQIIILQGIAGSMPWFAFGYLTLYFQLLGFSDWHASLLVAMFGLSTAFGSFIGGLLGDIASVNSSNNGRIIVAQVSTGLGLLLSIVLLRGLPHDDVERYYAGYMSVLILMGLTVSWCSAACIGPVFSEIVPEHLRSMIYAYDRCMEVAIAACATPVVGLVAEYFYGYEGPVARRQENMSSVAAERHVSNAKALGSALLISLMVPYVFSLVCYGLLYRSYPKDKARLILPDVYARLPPVEV
mmetsp:Transcript_5450/g.15171  ORF Transcript_5450/g.15171 Transcript_5450/m.15171 type:complete len:500 (+) Transcript_5450:565-2064(+)|eukprot:CAMPEP_0117673302 /NCGR_PEP_ID=MMETSP0804-20121206/14397_1 /TAXON_ID=1074897 /ORGANISM="Tetraselmis astigmatica, Strain CCMP880" /LENGTH=499 /DNA_ID=CAMNT_0005482025 /DNA_START=480 /DNA_END=1979 /DNA_ORIENTATION=+